ncbi:MAG: PilZ domain-containing protein [Candidatus Omnitrophica bacterium]|nr:PilZ domain-containing protein [Candidatus Omnitrophota bacterium]MBU1996323.1 PilZ domain-containing protein [Candidatus Omnitrophota bacterium]MBU4333887.1 PilZ domain-containing protein [Candidatus Omnitrophota bacterium]
MYKSVQEKRSFQRVECRNLVRFKLKDSAESEGCLAHDISDGGIKINLNEFVPLNSEVNLEVQLATQRIVDCVARIVWIEKMPFMDRYQAGLEFDNDRLERNAKIKIHGYTHPRQ